MAVPTSVALPEPLMWSMIAYHDTHCGPVTSRDIVPSFCMQEHFALQSNLPILRSPRGLLCMPLWFIHGQPHRPCDAVMRLAQCRGIEGRPAGIGVPPPATAR